jgi:hypothetical protein
MCCHYYDQLESEDQNVAMLSNGSPVAIEALSSQDN